MSQALASARKRRGVPQTSPEFSNTQNNATQQPNVNSTGLTLPQVISIVDRRLTTLEQFMKETKETKETNEPTTNNISLQEQPIWIDEFNHRFEILAEELNNIKDIVLKLQSYTMDVNKTLLEERINVFSDLGNVNNTNNTNAELQNVTDDLTSFSLKNLVQQEFDTINDL
jgi:hypothetical protein